MRERIIQNQPLQDPEQLLKTAKLGPLPKREDWKSPHPVTHDDAGQPLTFLNSEYFADRNWTEHCPKGRTFNDAVYAFRLNSYKASERVGRYEITEEQEFELAKVAASNHGAVFSELVKYFKKLTEEQRFIVGVIAAIKNNWANVKFDVAAFGQTELSKTNALVRAAVRHNDYQVRFLGDWGLPREEVFKHLKIAACVHGLEVLKHEKVLGSPLSPEERKEVFFAVARGKKGFDLLMDFEAGLLPKVDDRFKLAATFAGREKYFLDYLPNFALPVEDPRYRKLVERNLKVPETHALRYPASLHHTDKELLSAYFRLRERDCRPTLNFPKNAFFYQDHHDPIELIARMSGIEVPDFLRPGEEPPAPLLMFQLRDPESEEILHDSRDEDLLKESRRDVDDLAAFAEAHPDLLPGSWVAAAYSDFKHRMLAFELIRQCYKLSREGDLFQPQSPLHIACSAAGIACNRKPEEYPFSANFNLTAELISLSHMFQEPAFKGITVDEHLLSPENAPRFTQFLHIARERVEWDCQASKHYEWDAWLRLVKALKIKETGISLENLDALCDKLDERPQPVEPRGLP